MKTWTIRWPHGTASIVSTAAVLRECRFRLPSGNEFSPFAQAPWANEFGRYPELKGHMRLLGGEFVCVPFGIGGKPEALCPDWDNGHWHDVNAIPHGLSADAEWALVSADASHVNLRLEYPVTDDIEFLTRRIAADRHAPALELELTIHVRRTTHLSAGLHPILRLPEFPESVILEAGFSFGYTYPGCVAPGLSQVAPGQRFFHLTEVPSRAGQALDYSSWPKSGPIEDMIQLCGLKTPVFIFYPGEKARLRLAWDTQLLPSCLLWISDRAIAETPWNRSFRGLGVEPVAAVFDSAATVAANPNPISDAGVATILSVSPGEPLTIRYRIEAEDAW